MRRLLLRTSSGRTLTSSVGSRALDLAAAVSLVLCLATLAAWSCSFLAFAPFGQFWTASWAGNGDGYQGRGWVASNGSVYLLRDDRTMTPPPSSRPQRGYHAGIDPAPGVQLSPTRLSFGYFRRSSSWSDWPPKRRLVTLTTQQISFPVWLLSLLLAVPAMLRLGGALRRRRQRTHGLCLKCGYDLRATPEL